jgi:hypothetical protein
MSLKETVKNLFVLMDMEQFLNMHVEDLTKHRLTNALHVTPFSCISYMRNNY